MIGFVSRFIGLWFVAGALVAVVVDAAKTIAVSSLTMTSLGDTLFKLAPSALLASQEFVQRKIEPYVGGWLWDPFIQGLLHLPTWAILAAIGFFLTYLGRKRRIRVAFA